MTPIEHMEEVLRLKGWYLLEKNRRGMEFENDNGRTVKLVKEGREVYISCFSYSWNSVQVRAMSTEELKIFMELAEMMKEGWFSTKRRLK